MATVKTVYVGGTIPREIEGSGLAGVRELYPDYPKSPVATYLLVFDNGTVAIEPGSEPVWRCVYE